MDISMQDGLIFPAKIYSVEKEEKLGISVYQHNLLAAYVLEYLLNTFSFPNRGVLIPSTLESLAGLHDIGKINPIFLRKLLMNINDNSFDKKYWKKYLINESRKEIYHSWISYETVFNMSGNEDIAEIVGMHHGFPMPLNRNFNVTSMGGEEWEEIRENIGNMIIGNLNLSDRFPKLPRDRFLRSVLKNVWLGLIVVADWIASQIEHPLQSGSERKVAEHLVAEAGFACCNIRKGLSFQEIFGFSPREAQADFINSYSGPGVYVFEAPTGYGKTEAALGIAYKALEEGDANGIYFALPTQLTSNRIYERFKKIILNISNSNSVTKLIHGSARLLQTNLGKEAAPGGSWFNENRRALLAPFGVGTVDQALLSEIGVKFSSVRAAGLLGKVIIFDEIHSYDAYTSTLITDLIKRLEALGNVVVVLSATLTQAARNKLLNVKTNVDNRYPTAQITKKIKGSTNVKEIYLDKDANKNIQISIKENESESVFNDVERKARSGQQILWIENTVSEAQHVYRSLQGRGIESGLIHSQLRSVDRIIAENTWTPKFGKEGWNHRNDVGRVLVGTQVLEQSLDLDADFLVTRLAPIDLLVQRFGRLWRHQNTPRVSGCNRPEVYVLEGAEKTSQFCQNELQRKFGKSAFVYSPPYILWRTYDFLHKNYSDGCGVLSLPEQAGKIIEAVYCDRVENDGEIIKLKQNFIEYSEKLSNLARGVQSFYGLSQDNDEEPSTRYIDRISIPILIVLEDELNSIPSNIKELALWLERRIVKTYDNIVVKDKNIIGFDNTYLMNFLGRSSRFSKMPIFLCKKNEELISCRNLKSNCKLYYSPTVGLYK